MVLENRILRRVPVLLGLLAIVLVVPGCPLSPSSDGEGGGNDPTDLPERVTPAEAIQYYQLVWKNRLYNEYAELLHDNFEFFFRDDDASDFPWVQGDSWGRTDELAMAANMFDPDFQEPGGDSQARRIETIEMDLTLRNELPAEGGIVRMTYDVEAFVWFNSTDALHTLAVFEFEVVQGDGGKWQLLSQREREPL